VEVTKATVEAAVRRIDPDAVASARWFGGKGRAIRSIELAEAFVLPGDGRHVLAVANVVSERAPAEAYLFPLVADAGALRPAAEGDGTLRALAGAIAEGRTIPALPSVPEGGVEPAQPAPVTAALVCRPASGLGDLEPGGAAALGRLAERPLGMDQSNTSVVLGELLLLKAYRWLQPGLNPDLELVAYLTEEAGFSRRKLLIGALLSAFGGLGAALAIPLFSLGPAPGKSLFETSWREGSQLAPPDGSPAQVADLPIGGVFTVFPFGDTSDPNAATLLIRVEPELLELDPEAAEWAPDGYIAYSKICTHAGCPVGLYRAAQHTLICPCHQSEFDVLRGARPISGPAARPLPQLPIARRADGTFVALGDYPEPVGPAFWNMLW